MTPRQIGRLCGIRTALLDTSDLMMGRWPGERRWTRADADELLQGLAGDLDDLIEEGRRAHFGEKYRS